MGHSTPRHSVAIGRCCGREFLERGHDTEQPQEGCESGTEEVEIEALSLALNV